MMVLGCSVLLFLVPSLCSCTIQDAINRSSVFVREGTDLFLELHKSVALDDYSDFRWKFNGKYNLVKIYLRGEKIHSHYDGRVTVQNYSLLLKTVQVNDSGSYDAYISDEQELHKAGYEVTVQSPVSSVEMTVDSSISDMCNLTATCRSQDAHISSTITCDNQTCSQEGGERSEVTPSGASLRVYLQNVSIICYYSNQVSWTQNVKMVKDFCTKPEDSEMEYIGLLKYLPAVIIVAIFSTTLTAVYFQKKRKNKRDKVKDTETTHDDLQINDPTQPLNQSETSNPSLTSTYCLVGPHTGSVAPTNTPMDSLYAQVQKPAST